MRRYLTIPTIFNRSHEAVITGSAGRYQLSTGEYFANIRRGSKYMDEMSSKWYADLRTTFDGKQIRGYDISNTMQESIDWTIFRLERL
tara:strand:- start:697 stop:960 length:264 start_codon:yes stop_codon:yes gene_type:complete